MKIFVNYFYDANADRFHILKSQNYVLATEDVAILDTNMVVKEPLVVPTDGPFPIIVDREPYEKNNRLFCLKINDDGTLTEVKEGKFNVKTWFSKDTDVSKLRFVNGQIIMIDDEKKEESKED